MANEGRGRRASRRGLSRIQGFGGLQTEADKPHLEHLGGAYMLAMLLRIVWDGVAVLHEPLRGAHGRSGQQHLLGRPNCAPVEELGNAFQHRLFF